MRKAALRVGAGWLNADGIPAQGIAAQIRAAIANLNAVLAAAGMAPSNLAMMTIFLTDAGNLPGFMEAGGGALPVPPPATTWVIVKALAHPELLVQIEAVAVG